ncbi:MAG: helix-turn-helix domain-containing protein, partial [Lachnospiraceae bacterium]|nr:helix-turn-helix domain-containing protein [Lachnospiraceae bacterium]
MTQAQLAQKLGVTDKAVSKWERDLSYPDMALFPKLADILGVTANDLLRESLDESRPSRLLQILSMSRDIRTPLHIIIGSANLAGIHRDDPKLLQHYLDSIRISGEYLLKMIDRLMEVAEQDQNSRQPYFQTDIQELGEYLNREEDASTDPVPDYDFSEKRILVAEDIRMNREIAA